MGRLYTVGLISKSQMRDIQLELILNDNFDNSDYIHEGEFSYIFEYNDVVSKSISLRTKVYKTIGGAKRFRDKLGNSSPFKLKYPILSGIGNWTRNTNGDYTVVVIDITNKWDSLIDRIVQQKRAELEKELSKLESMKSEK